MKNAWLLGVVAVGLMGCRDPLKVTVKPSNIADAGVTYILPRDGALWLSADGVGPIVIEGPAIELDASVPPIDAAGLVVDAAVVSADVPNIKVDQALVWGTPDPCPLAESSLVAEWRFEEGKGLIARDGTLHGHDGVIAGATWIEEGVLGGGLHFDGTGSVRVPQTRELDIDGAITMVA